MEKYTVWTQYGSPMQRNHDSFDTLAEVAQYLSTKIMQPQDYDVIDNETHKYVSHYDIMQAARE